MGWVGGGARSFCNPWPCGTRDNGWSEAGEAAVVGGGARPQADEPSKGASGAHQRRREPKARPRGEARRRPCQLGNKLSETRRRGKVQRHGNQGSPASTGGEAAAGAFWSCCGSGSERPSAAYPGRAGSADLQQGNFSKLRRNWRMKWRLSGRFQDL